MVLLVAIDVEAFDRKTVSFGPRRQPLGSRFTNYLRHWRALVFIGV